MAKSNIRTILEKITIFTLCFILTFGINIDWTSIASSPNKHFRQFGIDKVEAEYTGELTYIMNVGGIAYEYQKFLSSGTFIVPAGVTRVDVTVVGGGGGGNNYSAGGGGGGGYVSTTYGVLVSGNVPVVIGAGGLAGTTSSSLGKAGGTSSFGTISSLGGRAGTSGYAGNNGGSGGGAGGAIAGGSGGSNGADGESTRVSGGKGQGTSTTGIDGVIYAGGGGAGINHAAIFPDVPGSGGIIGGGNGGRKSYSTGADIQAGSGIANTGGGGGGSSTSSLNKAGKGGSGIVIIRWLANREPTISVTTPSQNWIFGTQDTTVVPQISVSDPDNNALTVKYYIDGVEKETKAIAGNTTTPQTVSFTAVNMGALSEGAHTMKFEASDGSLTAQATVNFTVDKTPPAIASLNTSSTATSITVSGSASDALAGMDAAPYRYTVIDGTSIYQSQWTANTTYTQGSLQPNKNYTVKLEAKDKVGNIAQSSKTAYTKAEKPAVTISNITTTSMDIVVGGNNPSSTQYKIMAGTKYISSTGALTDIPQWITLTNKRITATGLTPNTTYTITAKARNGANEETDNGAAVTRATLPNAPENITAQPDKYFITLTWSAMPNITSYEVSADGITNNTGTATTYTHNDLTPNTQHNYKVRAVNTGGAGTWSDTLTVSTLPDPPGIPINLRAEAAKNEITLAWDAVEGSTSYDIEADGSLKENITTTTYTHTGLMPNTPHTYRVRAKNRGGVGEWSDILAKDTLPDPPGIPEGLNITGTTKDTITLAWSAVDKAEGYDIEADGAIIGSTTETTYTHIGLVADTEHTYRVRARNRGGESGWTTEAITKTLPEKPSVPNNLTATAGIKEITISWDNAERAAEYDIEAEGVLIATITGTSYTHQGLTPDTKHTFRIKARNAGGESDYSAMVTAYTLSETTGIAMTNVAAVVSNTSITLMWDSVAADIEYDIEVDGEIKDNGKSTIYVHSGLQPVTSHTYKVRPKRGDEKGPWRAVLAISTLPDPPDAPNNIKAIVTNTTIQLMWDTEEGATSYDIEIDGSRIESTADTTYVHKDLTPGTQHSYRIRARNITGETPWSEAIVKSTIKPTYMIDARAGEEYHIALTAMGMQEFKGRKIVLTYNPAEVEIKDLYEETRAIDLESGSIPGSNITVNHTPGRIEIEFDKMIEPGKAWTGVMNTILIKSKVDGYVSLDYLVE